MEFYLFTTCKTFDVESKRQIVGGVQTYSRDMCLLAIEKGFTATIYQFDEDLSDYETCFDGISLHIIHKTSKGNQSLFNKLYKEKNHENALFVVATDQMDIKTDAKNVIVIQHGIAFDCPIENGFWSKTRFFQHLNKMLRCIKNVRRLYWSCNTVGVDYNYFNWFRTLGILYPGKKYRVIPNYSSGFMPMEQVALKLQKRKIDKTIRVLFARRFCSYRGTLIFANCIDHILPLYSNVEFTFAGDGELKNVIQSRYLNNTRVHITCYEASNSIEFHKDYDIAVVPTVFSEGTSLSLLEAMSAGCFPIATHVGGLTNIILDHYNGLLCYPDEAGVLSSLLEAINMDNEQFDSITNNAYHTAKDAFSIERWKQRWSLFIDELMESETD